MDYIVYRTTNNITGCYYIGVHKTKNFNDGYLGSGLIIKRAIEQYGRENFSKQVLCAFSDKKEACAKEREYIAFAAGDVDCYNLHEGGHGGWSVINAKKLNNKNGNFKRATEARVHKIKTDPVFREQFKAATYKGYEKARLNPKFGMFNKKAQALAVAAWTGQHHSKDSIKKMSEAKSGERHNFYGMKWMKTADGVSDRVPPDEVENRLANGWTFGRVYRKRG